MSSSWLNRDKSVASPSTGSPPSHSASSSSARQSAHKTTQRTRINVVPATNSHSHSSPSPASVASSFMHRYSRCFSYLFFLFLVLLLLYSCVHLLRAQSDARQHMQRHVQSIRSVQLQRSNNNDPSATDARLAPFSASNDAANPSSSSPPPVVTEEGWIEKLEKHLQSQKELKRSQSSSVPTADSKTTKKKLVALLAPGKNKTMAPIAATTTNIVLPALRDYPLPPLRAVHYLYNHPSSSSSSSSFSAPSISPLLLQSLSRSLLVGVMGFSAARIEIISQSWGKYLPASNLFFFADELVPHDSRVIHLPHSRAGENVTDHRGSAWKILPAVKWMYEHANRDTQWFYLCDDDTMPLIHQIATLVSTWDPRDDIYAGESTGQNRYMHAYYRSDEESGKVGRQMNLRYQCTGGGVVFSRSTLSKLVPVVGSCPVFFASDVSLGYCLREYAAITRLTPIHTMQHAYPRTPEEVATKFHQEETGLLQAAAFHHMKPQFIYKDGIPRTTSPQQYMQESENRLYYTWMYSLALLRIKQQQDPRFDKSFRAHGTLLADAPSSAPDSSAAVAPPSPSSFPSSSSPSSLAGSVPLLRVAFVHVTSQNVFGSSASTSVNDKIAALVWGAGSAEAEENEQGKNNKATNETKRQQTNTSPLPFGLAFFTPLAFQTDYILVDPTPALSSSGDSACSLCNLHSSPSCHSLLTGSVHELYSRHSRTDSRRSVRAQQEATQLAMGFIDWAAYDLVVQTQQIVSEETRKQYRKTTVFTHVVTDECKFSSAAEGESKVPSLQFVDLFDPAVQHLQHATATADSSLSLAPSPIPFPLSSPFLFSFYGSFDLLRRPSTLSVGSTEEESVFARTFLAQWLVDADAAFLDKEKQLKQIMEELTPSLVGRRIDMVQVASMVPFAVSPGSDSGIIDRSARITQYLSAAVCVFTAGFEENPLPPSPSIPTPRAELIIVEEILIAIACGCHSFFSDSLLARHRALLEPLRSPPHSFTEPTPLASLKDATSYFRHYFAQPLQPFPNRLGLVEAGRQRMELNRVAMEQPLDALVKRVAQQYNNQQL